MRNKLFGQSTRLLHLIEVREGRLMNTNERLMNPNERLMNPNERLMNPNERLMNSEKPDSHLRTEAVETQAYSREMSARIKSLEEEIELTIYNYDNILQTEKKSSADRSEFLLYLIQSLRTRHLEELEAVNIQIQNAEEERDPAKAMQKQMQNIGEGLHRIVQEAKVLKETNEQLNKQLADQQDRELSLDEDIRNMQQERLNWQDKADEEERLKIRWNRQKRQLVEMINDAESIAAKSLNINKEECFDWQKQNYQNLHHQHLPNFRNP